MKRRRGITLIACRYVVRLLVMAYMVHAVAQHLHRMRKHAKAQRRIKS